METKNTDYKELLKSIQEKSAKKEKADLKKPNDATKQERDTSRDIAFEEIPDFTEEKLKQERGNINFKNSIDLSFEVRLENLETKQDQIINMLQQLIRSMPARFPGYLSIEEAIQKYRIDHTVIQQKMSLFCRVKNRRLDMRCLNDEKFYNEQDMTEAVLLDQKIERQKLLDLLK